MSRSLARGRHSVARRAILLWAFVLVLGLVGGSWLYLAKTRSFSTDATRPLAVLGLEQWKKGILSLTEFHRCSLASPGGRMVGCAAALLAMLTSLVLWRCSWKRRLRAKDEEGRRTAAGLQNQLTEARRAKEGLQLIQAELEERTKRLASANASLQEESEQTQPSRESADPKAARAGEAARACLRAPLYRRAPRNWRRSSAGMK